MAGKKAEKMGEEWQAVTPEGWLEEATGFDPYWTPEIGSYFRAMVIDIDDHDRNFIRYRLQNMGEEALSCKRGPAADAEEVLVEPGEHFTCSAYASLPLHAFYGAEVMVVVFENRKLPGNEASEMKPRDLWIFKVLVSPEVKKQLADQRRANAVMLREAAQKARIEKMLVSGTSNGGRPGSKSMGASTETA